jgi:hypothetical protein
MDHIRSGPAELVLEDPLRFRRRTCFNGRFNPCGFDKFLQALQSSETIRTVRYRIQRWLGITEDEWALLVSTTGRIRDTQNLTLWCETGSHDFRAVANALKNARSLHKLKLYLLGQHFPGGSSGLTALANALFESTRLAGIQVV